jgi:hypothetical protein
MPSGMMKSNRSMTLRNSGSCRDMFTTMVLAASTAQGRDRSAAISKIRSTAVR